MKAPGPTGCLFSCSICNKSEASHKDVCQVCNHVHKTYIPGKACDVPIGAVKCACKVTDNRARGGIDGAVCAQFVKNDYAIHRDGKNMPNPFEESGGKISKANSVVLMSAIQLQTFKDAIVKGITDQGNWAPNTSIESVPFIFGPGTVATIELADTLASFNGRQKGSGIKAKVHCGLDGVYRFAHWAGMIA